VAEVPPLAEVAAAGADALLSTHEWMHRRVYQLGYTARGLTQMRISVDLTIDDRFRPFQALEDGTYIFFIPVLLLRKWPPLLSLDLRDEAGRSLPLLTSDKNREVDASVLEALPPPGLLKETAGPTLHQIAVTDKQGASGQVEALGTVIENAARDLPPDERHRWRQTLLVASSLASNSLLWARLQGEFGKRTIVKIAFQDETKRELIVGRRILTSLSWAPKRVIVPFPNAGEGNSLHIQVDPPPELRIHRARLQLVDPLEPPATPLGKPKRSKRRRELWWTFKNTVKWRFGRNLRSGPAPSSVEPTLLPEEVRPSSGEPYSWETDDRAYLYVSGERKQAAVAEIDLAVDERIHLKSSAVATSGAIMFLLTFATVLAAGMTKHVEASTTLFLLVPALLGYLVIRPGEHPLLREHLAGIRVLLLAAGALPVVAAAILLSFSDPTGPDVRWWWFGLAVTSLLITGALVLSLLLPPIKEPFRPQEHADN